LVLKAAPGGLVLISPRLEVRNRRTGAWEPASDNAGHAPITGAVYRVGEVVLMVEV